MTGRTGLGRARAARTGFAAALAALLLTGCAPASDAAPEDGSTAGAGAGALLELEDGWAKAGEQGGMTAVFGTLVNPGDEDLVVTGAESDAAESVELHEVGADGAMRELDGGFELPGSGSLVLEPGGFHIMLMGLTRELLAGDEVTVTVRFGPAGGADPGAGSTAAFTVLVKDYAGADEEYDEHGDH